jgi:hypothetical protein
MLPSLLLLVGTMSTAHAEAPPFARGVSATPGLDALSPSDRRESLRQRFDAHFDAGASEHDHADPRGCLTGLVLDLKANWSLFDAPERARMTRALAPFKKDLLDAFPAQPPAPPMAEPTDSCFGQQRNYRLPGAHFVVEYDDADQASKAERFLEALEYSYTREVDELGWLQPLNEGQYLMPAFIENGNYQGAYTTVDYCGSGYYPYIVAYEGSWSSASWADTMAAHELNHALQFGYGFAHEFWWWEATATYVEDSVYDSDWWAYYVSGYTDNPQIAMDASSQDDQDIFWHMYGMAIWAFYLDEYQGGLDTVLGTWEAARGERGTYTFSQEDALSELGLDFDSSYLDFSARNVLMDYADQRILPEVDTRGSVDELPASGGEDGRNAPEGYGQNYIAIDEGLGEGDLRLVFAGEDAVEWAVMLVEHDGQDMLRVASARTDAGAAELVLEGYGAHPVGLVVTPLAESDNTRDYAYTLDLIVPEPEPEPEDTGADTDVAEDGEGEKVGISGGCGCATPADRGADGGALAAISLLAGAVLARRRRA